MTRMSKTHKRLIRQACMELGTFTAREVWHSVQEELKTTDSRRESEYRMSLTYLQVKTYVRTSPEIDLLQCDMKDPRGKHRGEAVYRIRHPSKDIPMLQMQINELQRQNQAILKEIAHMKGDDSGTKST